MTRSSIVFAVIGVLLLVGAAVVRFAVVPSVSKLPTDFSTTQDYEGTYSGLNPAVLAGAGGRLLLQAVPVTATRSYAVDSTDGNTAVVTQTVERSIGGQADQPTKTRYAVDRTDFESVPAPSGAQDVVPSKGLIFTLPLDPSTSTDYQLWDQTTAKAYPLTYASTSQLQGRTVQEYRSVADGTVADPASLGLPTSVTKDQLLALRPVLATILSPDLLAQLPGLLPRLPDQIPVTYRSATTAAVFADSTIGSPLRVTSTQVIAAQINLGTTVEVPFSTVELTTTPDSTAALADDTASKASTLNWIGVVLPIALAVLGLVLIVVALWLARRAATTSETPPPVQPDVPQPAGV